MRVYSSLNKLATTWGIHLIYNLPGFVQFVLPLCSGEHAFLKINNLKDCWLMNICLSVLSNFVKYFVFGYFLIIGQLLALTDASYEIYFIISLVAVCVHSCFNHPNLRRWNNHFNSFSFFSFSWHYDLVLAWIICHPICSWLFAAPLLSFCLQIVLRVHCLIWLDLGIPARWAFDKATLICYCQVSKKH